MVNIIKYVNVKVKSDNEDEEKEETIELCPECQSKDLINDFHRLETYCADCGLIVKSYDIITFEDMEYLVKLKEKEKEAKKKKKMQGNSG